MNAADRKARYARSFPVLSGEVVTQGHADWCRDHGHATNRVDGVLDPFCPRCGASIGETEQLAEIFETDNHPTGNQPTDDVDAVETCPACGNPTDYCPGHGQSDDPVGYAILQAHDNDDHSHCVASVCVS